MNRITQNFVDELVAIVPAIETEINRVLAEWSPEPLPVTTMFETMADVLADKICVFDNALKTRVFDLIEYGLSSGDDELETAVATGLIEGLVGCTGGVGKNWEMIQALLGEKSRQHADAWMGG